MAKPGWFIAFAFIVLLWGHADVAAQQSAVEQIDAIYVQSEHDNAQALSRLLELGQSFDTRTPYVVRREFLKVSTFLEIDAGNVKDAARSTAQLKFLAKEQNDVSGLALATALEGGLLVQDGKSSAALAKLVELEPVAVKDADVEVLWHLYFFLGKAQLAVGRFEPALESLLKCLQFSEQQKKHPKIERLKALNRLSHVYIAMKNWDKSLDVIREALVLAKEIDSQKMLATLYLNQGVVYSSQARLDDSVTANNQALKIARQSGFTGIEATLLLNTGDIYLRNHSYTLAERWSRQALVKNKEAGDQVGVAIAHGNIGIALMGQGKIAEGVAQARAGIKISHDNEATSDEEDQLAELGRMYEQAGMYREAVATIREQQQLSDQLFRVARERAVASLQEQFDAAQRQKQIELLARENSLKDAEIRNHSLQQIVSLLATLVAIMAGAFLFLMYRRVRHTNQRLVEVNQQLEFHSVRDPLTGLYNRRSFLELMKRRPSASVGERREDLLEFPDGLMILDIDHFKPINDSLGHAVGDAVLVEVARRLRATVRDSDMVMRWGGEEFLVFSPKTNASQLKGLAERLLHAVGEKPVVVGSQTIPVTVTGGFLSLPFSGLTEVECSWEKAMQIADLALYLGKVHGRNRAYGLTRLLAPFAQAMPVLEHDLAAALQANLVELIEVVGPTPSVNLASPTHI